MGFTVSGSSVTYSRTLHGKTQTVTWTGGGGYYETAEQTVLIQQRPSLPPLVITGWTPDPIGTGTTFRNGAVLNPPANLKGESFSVDGRLGVGGLVNSAPITMLQGDSLIICRSYIGTGAYSQLPYAGGQLSTSPIETMLCVIAVNYDPSTNGPVDLGDLLAPPGIGNSTFIRYLRAYVPFPESMIDMTKLPNYVNHAALPGGPLAGLPLMSNMANLVGGFCGDLFCHENQPYPAFQHPGYGIAIGSAYSQVLTMLCSNATTNDKYATARGMVQTGIHLFGAFSCGKYTDSYGNGQCLGRKAPIVFAGHMLGLDWMRDIDSHLQIVFPGKPSPFEESDRYHLRDWWALDGGGVPYFRIGYRAFGYSSFAAGLGIPPQPATYANVNGFKLTLAPTLANWGDPQDPLHASWGFCFQYYGQAVPAYVGTALAMQMMGLTQYWVPLAEAMMYQHMGTIPAAISNALVAYYGAGWDPTVFFGVSYSECGEPRFCGQAWTRYSIRYVASVDTTAETITFATAHGFSANQQVRVKTMSGLGVLPGGLAINTTYYVIVTSPTVIQLSASSGGAALPLAAGFVPSVGVFAI